jgi:hypothetical protein
MDLLIELAVALVLTPIRLEHTGTNATQRVISLMFLQDTLVINFFLTEFRLTVHFLDCGLKSLRLVRKLR